MKTSTIEAMQDDMAPKVSGEFTVLDDGETYGSADGATLVIFRNGKPRYFDLNLIASFISGDIVQEGGMSVRDMANFCESLTETSEE